jgi:glycosyltransferase involved in cell wall biosynthesis
MKATFGSPERQDTSRTEVRVSVVIPSYNSEKTIVPCLESVMRQKCDFPFAVIVVDSSQDRTPELIRSRFPQVHLIHLPKRTLQGTARNLGFRESSGEIVVFLDSDCIASDHWLTQIENAFLHGYAAVGGGVRNGNPQSLISWAGYFMEFSEWLPRGSERVVSHIPTCNIAYRRDIFQKYGGFADGMVPLEDFELNMRMYHGGERVLFLPNVTVDHSHRTRLQDFLSHQAIRGKAGARVRQIICLHDTFIVRFPFLAPLVFPPKRIGSIGFRVLRWSPVGFCLYLMTFPLLLWGTAFWVRGFMQEVRSG